MPDKVRTQAQRTTRRLERSAQQGAASLGQRLQGNRTELKAYVPDKADNPPSEWRRDISDAAPSIRWTDNVRGGVANRLETVSSQVEGLASRLGEYSPEPVPPESGQSSAQSSEQDLRLRANGAAAARGGHQTGI